MGMLLAIILAVALVDPEMGSDQVMRGFHSILNTPKELPENTGDYLSCTNCHFNGGNTLGGTNNGISLVGVTLKYPRNGETLQQRINQCFERSMNGKPLNVDSVAMQEIVAYLEWISSGVKRGETLDWLGLKPLKSTHIPDSKEGERLYLIKCADCHGKRGTGQERPDELSYPPLWGKHSFNKGAGMNHLNVASSFIYYNMPLNNIGLKEKEAIDIASFLVEQERPD